MWESAFVNLHAIEVPRVSTQVSHEDTVLLTTYFDAPCGSDYEGDAWVGNSHESDGAGIARHCFPWIEKICADHGLAAELCAPAATALQALGMEKALLNCRRHRDPAGFTRHFHQWFDAFRTLKFLHLLRDAGWPMLPLSELAQETPWLWPGPADGDTQPGVLRQRVAAHWGWR